MKLISSLGNLEADSVVVEVEVGWVLSHENISHDEVVETGWEVHRLNSEQTLSLAELGDGEDVVNWVKGVSLAVNGERHGWQ